jgi:SAM-dependent methyltransferase
MIDRVLVQKLDAAWGDPEAWVAQGLQWKHVPEVERAVNQRVSGDPRVAPLDWFLRHVARAQPAPLARVLVLGCGLAHVERTLVADGHAREVVALDLSQQVVARAKAGADGLAVTYMQADMNDLPVGPEPLRPGSFDAVVGISTVHHCERLDALYQALHVLLAPGGWLFFDEYVGPERFQYDRAHMDFIEAVAETLPDRLLTTRSGQVRRGFRAPTVQEVIAVDPTEAVNSTRIVPLMRERFDLQSVRPYGGGLLELLLAGVAQNFMTPGGALHLQAVIQAEDDALRLGRMAHHFACIIARRRG